MVAKIMNGIICIALNRNAVLSEMSRKYIPDVSRVEIEKNL